MALTDAQHEMLVVLDDASEHVSWEFHEDCYQGFSTCGFAHIGNIDGRGSFVQRVRSLARERECVHIDEEYRHSGDQYKIDVGGLEASLRPAHDSGYRLSISNVKDYIGGPEFQRMDVRERLHTLLLEKLQENGYLENARVKSRMD
jgi:hypothetical protein